eukprot:Colp12_sorted_trinity150504_noHs@15131
MTSYSRESLEQKLKTLSASQESIQTLSLWVIHHKKYAKESADVWRKEVMKANASQGLTLIYLCNDILQNSRKKGVEFLTAFGPILAGAFSHVYKRASPDVRKMVLRILSIWEERAVFSREHLVELRRAVERSGSKSTSEPTSKPESVLGKRKKRDDELITILENIERISASDQQLTEKVENLPTSVLDKSVLIQIKDEESAQRLSRQVEDALILLAKHQGSVAAEVDERKALIEKLQAILKKEEALLKDAETKQSIAKEKLSKVTEVKQGLKNFMAGGEASTTPPAGEDRGATPPLEETKKDANPQPPTEDDMQLSPDDIIDSASLPMPSVSALISPPLMPTSDQTKSQPLFSMDVIKSLANNPNVLNMLQNTRPPAPMGLLPASVSNTIANVMANPISGQLAGAGAQTNTQSYTHQYAYPNSDPPAGYANRDYSQGYSYNAGSGNWL